MMPSVVLYAHLPADLEARLAAHAEISVVDSLADLSVPRVRGLLAEAHGLIGVNQTVGVELLDLAPKLRVISTISVGYDHFDVADLTRRGIMLMHTPEVLTETTADLVFALILCAARRITEMATLVRRGEWRKDNSTERSGTDVHGKKLGILGMGRIGQAVAKRGHAGFAMEILYYSRSKKEQAEQAYNARRLSLDELLAAADFVCAILPLTPETNKLIGARELGLMKKTAFLINGGRGPVIDEAALVAALQNGTIRGAGLDVYEREPL
ncbi:MAG: D-glycerate dehydrogenase, partial [Desulfofustis sp.]|nr:D-glycerate dehydrogenase [Desulfofustis sp.]